MADNTLQNGTDTIATDDVASLSAKVQRVKAGFGVDGSYADVSTSNGLPVQWETATTATLSNVSASASSVSLAASNAARAGLIVYNDSDYTLFLKFGTAASSTSFTYRVEAGGTYEMVLPTFTAAIEGTWDSSGGTPSGTARVTEL